MNQTQRSFLIKKIEAGVKAKKDALYNSIPPSPSLSNYLLHAVLSGTFEIVPNEEIKKIIKQKAVTSNDRDEWMGNSWQRSNKTDVVFKASDIFVIPKEYREVQEKYLTEKAEAERQINELVLQSDSLITRIQLASDKTLDKMIAEVDDMGDISLVDTTLKNLLSPSETKLIK
jgi:hypothetical protein